MTLEPTVDHKSQEKFSELLKAKIDSLLEFAPSDSTAKTSFKKLTKGYSGIIHIVSSQGKFMAEAVGHDVEDILKALSNQIHTQLKKWRSYRFDETKTQGA